MHKRPQLFTLFCDGVRHEIGGMQSIIGVFQDVALLKEMPQVLPRLSVFFNLYLYDADIDRVEVQLQRVDTGESMTAVKLNDVHELKKRLVDMDDAAREVGVKVNGTLETTSIRIEAPVTLRLCAHLTSTRRVLSSSTLTFDVADDESSAGR